MGPEARDQRFLLECGIKDAPLGARTTASVFRSPTTTIMKVLIICALVAACQATGVLHHAPILHAPAVLETGGSTQYRSQDPVGNYAFGYNEAHTTGGTFRRESGDAFGNKAGSYGLRDADGRVRVVNYVADALGYRADISSNEPGVAPKDPAAATINKGGIVSAVAAHPVAYAAAHPAAYGGHYGLLGAGYYGHGLLGAGYYGHGLHGAGHYGLGHYAYGPVGHYAYSAPGQVASASVLGAHHYAVKTHHGGPHYRYW